MKRALAFILLASLAVGCQDASKTSATATQAPATTPKNEVKPVVQQPKADSSSKVETPMDVKAQKEPQKPEFELTHVKFEVGQYGIKYVTGTLKSNLTTDAKFVNISINLYDDSETQVGSTAAAVQSLDAMGTWKFKAPVTENSATKFKIKDVTHL